MSQVSKRQLGAGVSGKLVGLFIRLIQQIKTSEQAEDMLMSLFSAAERMMMAKRISVMLMLVKGASYLAVQETLKVSQGTIAKMSQIITTAPPSVIDWLKEEADADDFTQTLDEVGHRLKGLLPPRGKSWSKWRRQLENERDKSQQPF
jgi:Trp operon repressor